MQDRVRVIVDADNGLDLEYGQYGNICASTSDFRITGYFFSSDHFPDRAARYVLVIPPFRLGRGRLTYLLQHPLGIDVRRIEPDMYQVHLVQDFWTDDDNPNLSERRAGIFLGRRRKTGEWEAPERWPIECRSLTILGTVDTRLDQYAFSAHHGD